MTGETAEDIFETPRAAVAGRSLRFLLVGGLNTAFGVALYPALLFVLTPLRGHYMVVLLIAQGVSLLFAFTTQRLLVFRSRGRILHELLKFSSFYLGIYAVNWVTLPMLVEIVRLKPWIAQLGFTAVTVFGSYFFHSRLTFRDQPVRAR